MNTTIEHIATNATLIEGKLTRSEVHQRLVNALPRVVAAEILTEVDAALLYKHFLPRPQAKPKTPEQWVQLAVATKKDPREYLHYAWSDGARFMASNGHRLHLVPTNLPPGFYDQALQRIDISKDPVRPSTIDSLLPEDHWAEGVVVPETLMLEPWEKKHPYQTPSAGAYRVPVADAKVRVRAEYWQQAVAGVPKNVSVSCQVAGTRDRIAVKRPDLGGIATILEVRDDSE